MPLQHIALRFVQPRNHDPFVTNFHSQHGPRESRFDLEPRVGRTFRSLPRRIFPAFHCRANEANRLQRISAHVVQLTHLPFPSTSSQPVNSRQSGSDQACYQLEVLLRQSSGTPFASCTSTLAGKSGFRGNQNGCTYIYICLDLTQKLARQPHPPMELINPVTVRLRTDYPAAFRSGET